MTSTLDRSLAALADPTRREILSRLSGGETRITDLAKPFPISLNSVSKHVRVLEAASLVKRRVQGREHLLSLNLDPFDEVAAYVNAQKTLWTSRLRALDEMLQEEDRL